MTRNAKYLNGLLNALILACVVFWAIAVAGTLRMVHQPFPGFRVETTLTVSAASEAHWNGTLAKLQQFDRLLKLDDQPLVTARQLDDLVRSRPVGTTFHYEFEREGKLQHLAIASQEFTLLDWFKSFLPLLLIGLLHVVVGAVAFWMKPTSATARVHLLMTCATSLFATCGTDYDAWHVLGRVYLASFWLMGSTYFHLGLVFPASPLWLRRRGWMHLLPYLPALAMVPVAEFCFRPTGKAGNPSYFDLHMNLLDLSFLWLMIGVLALLVAILVQLFRSKSQQVKQQAKVAVLGAAAAYLPGTLLWIVPTTLGHPVTDHSGLLVNFSFACFIFFPVSIAYAIVRHRMFDIDLVIKRTIVYTTVVAALSATYFLVIAGMTWLVEHFTGHADSRVGNVLATTVVTLAFWPVRQSTRAVIDRLFFRNRYDFRAVVSGFTRVTKENPELEAVLDEFVAVVEKTVHPRFMAALVRDPKAGVLQLHRTAGMQVFPPDFMLPAESPEVAELFQARRTGLRPSKSTTRQLAHMESLGIAFVVPLEIRGQILGLVTVGPKLSDLDYSAEDEALLMNLGAQLASIIRIAEMTASEVSRARLDAELATARAIQASLLPTQLQPPSGLEVAASSESAYEFGGDYYDVVSTPDGQLRVVVGDVAGKGVQAALVMAMTKSCFFNQVRVDPALPAVMNALNTMIMGSIDDKKHRKTTLVYAAIDPDRRVLRYACAGHQPPHYYNARTGSVEDLPIPGSFPFGASKLAKYQEFEVGLNPGDVLVFYTDGVTEAQNPAQQMFYRIEDGPEGEVVHDQLRLLLEAHHAAPAAEIHRRIVQAVRAWVGEGEQGDDITLVVVKIS